MGSKNIILVNDFKVNSKYVFEKTDKKCKIFTNKEFQENLTKWNMDTHFSILAYSFQPEIYEEDSELIKNLLQTRDILHDLGWKSLIDLAANEGTDLKIEIETVPSTILSLDFFDKIHNSIAIEDGTIRKCFEEYVGDIVVADQLRSMLLQEDSEHYSLFDDKERSELLFRLFKHFCIGGELNQYEDNVKPYLEISKALYKDIMCVRKVGASKTPTILSKVFKILCYISDTAVVPSQNLHEQDFAYIIINSLQREIIIMYHEW